MASHQHQPDDREEATEASPLLGKQNGQHDGSRVEAGSTAHVNEVPDVNDTELAAEPSTRELVAVLGTIWVGVFFAALDTTIVATLAAPISSDFDSLTLLSWLATGYLIANSACQPLAGKLTDIFSRRYGLVFSNIFFGFGCLICGLARKQWVIILGRVISGVGGGGLTAITTFVTSDLVPLRRRGIWQGYGNFVFGLGVGLGGVFGGLLDNTLGWRWAFLIQCPFILVSGLLVIFLVKIPVKETDKSALKRIDFPGASLLVSSLVLLLIGLNEGGSSVPWNHPLILTVLPLSFLLLVAFVYVEDRVVVEPIIPVRLLLVRTVWSACLTNWFSSMSGFIALYYVPFYLQVRGLSSARAGLRTIPFAVANAAGSLGVGFSMRMTGRYYLGNCAVMGLLVLGSALYSTFDLHSRPWQTFVYLVPGGIGYGGMLTTTLVAMISAVEHKDQAVITSASYAFRSTGSTIGITIASAVFQNRLSRDLWDKFGAKHHAAQLISRIRNDLDYLNHLPSDWSREGALECYMDAIRYAFVASLGLAAVAMICSLFMREHKLHTNLARK